ncbi:hypothetical protein PENANT_c024G09080 [Penicillium antarcticum]|uniref:Transcriptional regulator n=1 Tax=Penicillium antarcticum TaxID=416450 RepID=A0A1V6PYB9_9EURO|nr:hypothetical protein PENANT_c024G09080 [Penicillium antarcticum]
MSDSEEEDVAPTAPSDQTLAKGLRDGVTGVYKSGNMEELTVKRVRLAVEKQLGLTEGYFKSTSDWKARSEEIIRDEVERQDNAANNAGSQPAEASPSPSPKPKQTPLHKRAKAESAPKPRKRQKTKTPEPEEDDQDDASVASDDSEEVAKPKKRIKAPAKKAVPKPKMVASDVSDMSENESDAPKPPPAAKDDSESEMSVVLDNEPQPQPARKRKSADGAATKAKKAPKAAKAKDADLDPDQAEIKRLQGWLIKCGIRKLWGKELAPYDTSKAKIKHLKEMLDDAGMKGRPSQEKANQIREARELKADLEQIQQGAMQWGAKSDEEEGDGDAKPRRRLARGRQALAFLESDGEESG